MSNQSLKSYLEENNCFASSEESVRKREVIAELTLCFANWVLSRTVPKEGEEEVSKGRLLTLGSHKLGIDGGGADIDILLLAPEGITRDDCFHSFFTVLKEQFETRISYYRKIENTYVPVVKATISNIDVDLAFCCSKGKIPLESELLNDIHLKDMDIYCVRSLNGYRDCAHILQVIGPNIDRFRIVLRAVKLWASRRAIYNNSVGYFSGMALTVLVAKVILEFPGVHHSFSLLREFFKKYSSWTWPRPVMLHHLGSNHKDAPVLKIWNPIVYSFDKEDTMPILTPAYPQRNSAYTATISTRRVISQEFRRGRQLTKTDCDASLLAIFAPHEFFTEMVFEYYIVLGAESVNTNIQHHWDWCAIARSQIRKLVSDMELLNPVQNLHVCPNAYPQRDSLNLPSNRFHTIWFIGLSLNPTYSIDSVEVPEYLSKFKLYVEDYAKNHDIDTTGRSVSGELIEQHNFKSYLPTGIGCGVKGSTDLKEGRKGYFHYRIRISEAI